MAPSTASRHAFRLALAEIAHKAKATLPECNGREAGPYLVEPQDC